MAEKIIYKEIYPFWKDISDKTIGNKSASVPSYAALTITLQITDEETVEAYKDVHPDLILQDIRDGNLANMCDMVDVILE